MTLKPRITWVRENREYYYLNVFLLETGFAIGRHIFVVLSGRSGL